MRVLGLSTSPRNTAVALVAIALAVAGCQSQHPTAAIENGADAYRDGRYSDAELIWLETLAESEAYGEDDPRLAQSLRMLANLHIQQGRYDEAKPLLERWMDIRERRLETSDSTFADGLDALAGIHMVQNRYEEAAAIYERSIEVRRTDTMLDSLILAESLENLAGAYNAMGRTDDAMDRLRRAVSIREELLGAYDPSLAEDLHALAVIEHDRGHYREAEVLYVRALDIVQEDRGMTDLFAATALTHLGSLYRVLERHEEALE